MAQKESGDDSPSLELPSFGFGRKKKPKAVKKSTEPVTAPDIDTIPAPESGPAPAPEPAPESESESTVKPTTPKSTSTAKPAPAAEPVAPATTEPAASATTEPAASATIEPAASAATTTPTTSTPTRPATPAPARAAAPEPKQAQVLKPQEAPKPKREPRPQRDFSFPAVPGLAAALAVGALIGILAVLLTFSSLKLCEVVGGTDSCGGSGLLLLVAILVLLTYLGGWLLRGFRIEDPLSTSFLAVGLLAVMGMLFFLDVIYSRWMIVVIPLVSMASYALSWWVTTRIVDTEESGAS